MSEAFSLFFKGLARHAPGTDDDTRRALEACELPSEPTVLDLGAGTGSSTLVLAEELAGAQITAVDLAESSLQTLSDRAERRGLDNIETVEGDFMELDVEAESVDLIWSEGSVYAVGWESALAEWEPLLKPGGYLVVSDCVWVDDQRPEEAVAFWAEEYPAMTTPEALTEQARAEGFEVVETFELERIGWVDYYSPLRQRAQLFGSSETSDEMTEVIDLITRELEVFEAHGEHWNYAFFVLRKPL